MISVVQKALLRGSKSSSLVPSLQWTLWNGSRNVPLRSTSHELGIQFEAFKSSSYATRWASTGAPDGQHQQQQQTHGERKQAEDSSGEGKENEDRQQSDKQANEKNLESPQAERQPAPPSFQESETKDNKSNDINNPTKQKVKEDLEKDLRWLRGQTKAHHFQSVSSMGSSGSGDDDPSPSQGFLSGILRGWAQLKSYIAIRNISTVDSSFSEDEFLACAEDAFLCVNDMFAQADFEGLKPLISFALLHAFQQVNEEYAKAGLTTQIQVEEVHSSKVESASLVGLDEGFVLLATTQKERDEFQGGEYDELKQLEDYRERFKDSAGWLLISVRFKSTERSKIFNKEGLLVTETVDRRGHVWEFIRGPLPSHDRLPAQNLDTPWRVLNLGPPQGGGFVQLD